jgi:hypothetical protein
VEFRARVVGAGQTAAAQADGGHVEVPTVFLDHEIGGCLGGAEEAVEAGVDATVLAHSMPVGLIGVLPTGLEFLQRDLIGGVAIDLVGAHVDERRLRRTAPHGLEEVQRADGVDLEIVERPVLGQVVRRLGGAVDQEIGPGVGDLSEDRVTVPDVEIAMGEARRFAPDPLQVPGGVAIVSEEGPAQVVVDADHLPSPLIEERHGFGADQSAAAGDDNATLGGCHGPLPEWSSNLRMVGERWEKVKQVPGLP